MLPFFSQTYTLIFETYEKSVVFKSMEKNTEKKKL